jgi:hypothetical protein
MTGMVRPAKIALIAAVPIAILNLPPTFAIDVGLPTDANWFLKFIAAEWVVMHWLGLWLSQLDPYYHYLPLDIVIVGLSGYIEWTALLIAGVYAFLGLRRFALRFSVKQG